MVKRQSISSKKRASTGDIDTLFSQTDNNSSGVENQEPTKPILRNIADIKEFYFKTKGGKQLSTYLPNEIHKAVKAKAARQETSISEIYKNFVLNDYLTDEEIREAYKSSLD